MVRNEFDVSIQVKSNIKMSSERAFILDLRGLSSSGRNKAENGAKKGQVLGGEGER